MTLRWLPLRSVVVTFFFVCIKVPNLFLCTLGLTEASSKVLRNSFKIFKTSLSSSSNPSDMLTLLEEFCTTDVFTFGSNTLNLLRTMIKDLTNKSFWFKANKPSSNSVKTK